MEGDRILKELLKKKLDGLYVDTKNYLGSLRSLIEGKNGFTTTGCNTTEDMVSKYGAFCNKFLRCGIEVVKNLKEADKEFDQLLRLLEMVAKILNMVFTLENGKYQQSMPSLDDISKKLLLLANHLISKEKPSDALSYVKNCLDYLETSSSIKKNVEWVVSLASKLASIAWKGALVCEQCNSSKRFPKDSGEYLPGFILDWRLCALQAEALANVAINNLVAKAFKITTKFQMDHGAENTASNSELLNFYETLFILIRKRISNALQEDSKEAVNSLFSLIELGFHYGRTCLTLGELNKGRIVLEELQTFVGQALTPKTANTTSGSTLTRFCSCICGIGKVTLLMESIVMNQRTSKKSNLSKEFLAVNKLLDEIRRLLNLLVENRSKAAFPISTILFSLESFKSRILNKQNSNTVASQSRLAIPVPYQTCLSLEPVLIQYGNLLKLQAQSVMRSLGSEKDMEAGKKAQLKQQLQRTADKQMSLSCFIMVLYQSMFKHPSEDASFNRENLFAQCLQRTKQSSDLIHDLMRNDDLSIPDKELFWQGTLCFNLGADAYSLDSFKQAGALMMAGCRDLKYWCLLACSDGSILRKRLEEIKPKYQLLSDCLRRAKCLSEALGSSTTLLMIMLATAEQPYSNTDEVHEAVFDWIKVKHQLVKCYSGEKALEIRSKTLCNAMAEEDSFMEVTGDVLALVLQEELLCYKSVVSRYDVSVERLAVAKQLMELFQGEGKTLAYSSILLDYAQVLHSGSHLHADKAPGDYCQEAIEILESLAEASSGGDHSLVAVQDKLGSAYLLQGVLTHHSAICNCPAISGGMVEEDGDMTKTGDDVAVLGEDQVPNLDQPFIHALHAAVDTWTAMVELLAKESQNSVMDVTALQNSSETVQNISHAALLYGLVNQPLNQVHALHLCFIMARAIGSEEAIEEAIISYSLAIQTLCSIHDIHHVSKLLSCLDDLVVTASATARARVYYQLAKSHCCLLTGKFSEGHEHLQAALSSDILTRKTGSSLVLLARAKSLMAEYMLLPGHVYRFNPNEAAANPCDLCTPVEAVADSYSNLEGALAACYGQTVTGLTSALGEAVAPGKDRSDHSLRLLTLQSLLKTQLQFGTMLAHQGMVRQAIKYLTDGLAIAKRFQLPFRALEFMISLAEIKLHMGQAEAAKALLHIIASRLAPVLYSTESPDDLEEFASTPSVVGHPVSCHCVCCSDPALQAIQARFYLVLSRYFQTVSSPKLAIRSLEGTEALCSNGVSRARGSLDELSSTLQLGDAPHNVEEMKNKRGKSKGKASKGRKAIKDAKQDKVDTPTTETTAHAMFSLYFAQVFALNSELLLQRGKLKKAKDVLSAGLDTLSDVINALGALPPTWYHIHAKLHYLNGVISLSNCSELDKMVWPLTSGGNSAPRNELPQAAGSIAAEYPEQEDASVVEEPKKKTRKGRGRSAKTVKSKADCPDGNAEAADRQTSRTRGRRRGKKKEEKDVVEEQMDDHVMEERNIQVSDCKDENLLQAVECFRKALAICQSWPEPTLFSGVCRCLALCYGRANPVEASYYLNQSLAVTLRHEAMNSARKKTRKIAKDHGVEDKATGQDINALSDDLKSVSLEDRPNPSPLATYSRLRHLRRLMKFGSDHIQDAASIFPPDWTVCTLETVALPNGPRQLLLSRLRHGTEPVVLKLPIPSDSEPVQSQEDSYCEAVSKAVLDLSKLFQGSVEEGFTDVMRDSTESMSISSTKEWCQRRCNLDDTLKNLLSRLETSWLGKWRGVLLGRHVMPDLDDALHRSAIELSKRITARTGTPVDAQLIQILLDACESIPAPEVKAALSDIMRLQESSGIFKEVYEEFMSSALEIQPERQKASNKKKSVTAARERHPVILILGKELQPLPWESIPILRDYPVTRMPSLQFVLAHAMQAHEGAYTIDQQRTFYVLNPENNLPNTQKIFQKWFEGEPNWCGITGRKPSQEQYREALVEHDLFLYLGHGNGRSFLNGYDVQRLNCRATTILMGCSSGKLIVEGDCEPRGMSMNYLLAGCPAILANLWDVTDRDIDRFTAALLQTWLQNNDHKSLAQVLCQARKACKLQYLIGAAPVLYGMPVHLKR